jgi:hypothetical protein
MPLQNRVDPWGTLFRTPARGGMMGNRGPCIHNEHREIVRPFRGERWIACVLEFRSRHREVMRPGYYTELFFLDEAVSLSAGHRPCAECRRERFNAFKQSWPGATAALRAPEMDAALHRARIDDQWQKVTYRAPIESLPDGCFVQIDDAAYLLWSGALHLWTPEGYPKKQRLSDGVVTVLTPKPTVQCLRNGYRPEVHESA